MGDYGGEDQNDMVKARFKDDDEQLGFLKDIKK